MNTITSFTPRQAAVDTVRLAVEGAKIVSILNEEDRTATLFLFTTDQQRATFARGLNQARSVFGPQLPPDIVESLTAYNESVSYQFRTHQDVGEYRRIRNQLGATYEAKHSQSSRPTPQP